MVRLALTGGIATGKSGVLRLLQARAIPTTDSDVLAREVVAPGTAGLRAVVDRFGPGVLDQDGALNRRALAATVFANSKARSDLEAIVHPAVYSGIRRWLASLSPETPLAVADIPLLFETGHEGDFDRVLVVACPPEEQLRRVMARDRASEAEARARLAAQWPIADKAARADDVIWTMGTHEETARQVDELVQKLTR
jgi:dephospho-CoA kinase